MEHVRRTFVEWLRDAHAAEKQALTMLTAQTNRIENYPDLRTRIETHIDETEEQIALLQEILDSYGESGSVVKDMTGRLIAFGQSLSGMVTTDEVVKGGLFGYAFEQMEIASYRILISTAQRLGDTGSEARLQKILAQEEAMAGWLLENMPSVLDTYFSRLEAGETAKR